MLICPYQGENRKPYQNYMVGKSVKSPCSKDFSRSIIDLTVGAGEASLDTQVLQDFLIIDQTIKNSKKHQQLQLTDLDDCPARSKECSCHQNDHQRQSNSSDETTYSSSKMYQAESNSSSMLSVSQNSQNVDILLDIITDKVKDIQEANNDINRNLKEAESILNDLRMKQSCLLDVNPQPSPEQSVIRRRKNLPKINETESTYYNIAPQAIELKTHRRHQVMSPVNLERSHLKTNINGHLINDSPVNHFSNNNGSASVPLKRKEYAVQSTKQIMNDIRLNSPDQTRKNFKAISNFKATSNLDVRCPTTRRLLSASNSNNIDSLNRTVKYHYCSNYPHRLDAK